MTEPGGDDPGGRGPEPGHEVGLAATAALLRREHPEADRFTGTGFLTWLYRENPHHPAIDRRRVETLATCGWIREKETVLLQGPPGVGKATLAYRFARALLAGPGAVDAALTLAPDQVIEDPCLVQPLPVRALIDALEADNLVARAPVITGTGYGKRCQRCRSANSAKGI